MEMVEKFRHNITHNTSFSKCVYDMENVTHETSFPSYSSLKGVGSGKFITGPDFNVSGHDFAIHVYPEGIEDFKEEGVDDTYISIFIALVTEGRDVRALFELTLLDQTNNGNDIKHSHFDKSLATGPHTLKHRGNMWGYKRFIRRSKMEMYYIKDDSIKICCTVGVVISRLVQQIPIPPSDIAKDMKNLLESEIRADVDFHVGNERYKAHKLILGVRSELFRAQFFGHFADANKDQLEVLDVEPTIFKLMLQFVYSGELPDLDESADIVHHLLEIADRYALYKLKQICEEKLFNQLSLETVTTTLILAEQHYCLKLKASCLEFMASNMAEFLHSKGFKYIKKCFPLLMAELVEMLDEKSCSRKRRRQAKDFV